MKTDNLGVSENARQARVTLVSHPGGRNEADRHEAAIDNSAWTDSELDAAILALCEEVPYARMAACSRALEYCRRSTPRGTPDSLLTAMRVRLHLDLPPLQIWAAAA